MEAAGRRCAGSSTAACPHARAAAVHRHEPYPGQYVWSGFADLERWMRLIQASAAPRCVHA